MRGSARSLGPVGITVYTTIAPGAVGTTELSAGAVTAAKLGALAVTTAKIAAGAVTKAKAAVFVSAETTATGAAQNVAHGLGAVPALVLIVPTETTAAAIVLAGFDIAEGAHDGTNVKLTATLGLKFKVLAWA